MLIVLGVLCIAAAVLIGLRIRDTRRKRLQIVARKRRHAEEAVAWDRMIESGKPVDETDA